MSEEGVMTVDFANLGADVPEEPVRTSPYEYDYFVIGGGSGGLASAKTASELGAKVALADFVKPSPQGTSWGLGGTCVNVGCIPKKLMHFASMFGEYYNDQQECGWETAQKQHNWKRMVDNVQKHISTLNWGYRVQLIDKNVTYFNYLAKLVDNHTISLLNKDGQEMKRVTSEHILVAVGGRPSFGGIPGADECCYSSDDLFSLKEMPKKVLVVGASYISLECAGFLHALQKDVTVMVRSIFLRGFDQDMADKVAEYMANEGIKFIRNSVPNAFKKTEDGKVEVKYTENGEERVEVYDAVLMAIGRNADTKNLDLEKAGVQLSPRTGKVIVNDYEQSNVENIWAVGDVAEGKPELTPVAIQAGTYLAKRLFGGSSQRMDYINVPTTVFTPLEYSCCGYSEEDANKEFGEENIEVYHTAFKPLEWNFLDSREASSCYAKVIVNLKDNEKVVGIHFLGPHAGEVMQGFAVSLKLGLTKAILDETIGIHPTCAEEITKLDVTKRSGITAEKTGC